MKPNFLKTTLIIVIAVIVVILIIFVFTNANKKSAPMPETLPTETISRTETSFKLDQPTTTPSITATITPTPTITPTLGIGSIRINNNDGMEMVYVPEGDFQMGCDPAHNGGETCASNELPSHTVSLDAYWIDEYEVTNAQYNECVSAGGCSEPSPTSSDSQPSYYDDSTFAHFPVINVTWDDADNYCTWAGKRLPSEAEWEKAARGPNPQAFPWGDQPPTCTLVNGKVIDYCVGTTSEVGSYPTGASPYGAMDMSGNVWEWTLDWYSDNYYSVSPLNNPPGPDFGPHKVFRGGGWNSGFYYLRVVARIFSGAPDYRSDILGLRCAATP